MLYNSPMGSCDLSVKNADKCDLNMCASICMGVWFFSFSTFLRVKWMSSDNNTGKNRKQQENRKTKAELD